VDTTTLGIIGGGQLGLMMLEPARRLGIRTCVIDPSAAAPCAQRADTFILGSLSDPEKLHDVVRQSNVTTYEIEHIETSALQSLADAGAVILPSPASLSLIQDKLVQRQLLADRSLPVPDFEAVSFGEGSEGAAAAGEGAAAAGRGRGATSPFGYPVVQKACRGGYDGKGVFILRSPEEPLAPVESFWERFVEVDRELSVLVVRSRTGEVRCYDPVEMEVDAEGSLLRRAIAPARISPDTADYARHLAEATVAVFDSVGVFAVEMFLGTDGRLMVNEVAPRPHNSGHHTIEAAVTSQFEEHIRAVCGLPLGSTRTRCPAVTINIVGPPGVPAGFPSYPGLQAVLEEEGAAVHIYGKSEVRPWRKMGHITLFGDDLETLLARADRVEAAILRSAR
jgi:5-(carboxyamino)imidazole ribonucleotide synthase